MQVGFEDFDLDALGLDFVAPFAAHPGFSGIDDQVFEVFEVIRVFQLISAYVDREVEFRIRHFEEDFLELFLHEREVLSKDVQCFKKAELDLFPMCILGFLFGPRAWSKDVSGILVPETQEAFYATGNQNVFPPFEKIPGC